ncbi:MAG: hypothetical protein AAGL69_10715 [Pseudomonadota bacterium]
MTFEDELANLHEWHFFREFVYSHTTFRPSASDEVELADSVIWIGSLLFAYQLKERDKKHARSGETERRWFEQKVLGRATKQVRDTLRYLRENSQIALRNHRGHEFALKLEEIDVIRKLVIYLPDRLLPSDCRAIKHYQSSTAGFIHVISGDDYLGLVRTLLTPAEVSEYLEVREQIVSRWPDESLRVAEADLVGQYICGNWSSAPNAENREFVQRLQHHAHEWDLSGVISVFAKRITSVQSATDYYPIVRELALLKRNELKEFKGRFELAHEKAKKGEAGTPYRIAILRTGCGFVFIPINQDQIQTRQNALQNFTLAHKYDQRLSKCIGVSIADDQDDWFTVEWCYLEYPWEYDPEIERFLKENDPFLPVRFGESPRYTLDGSD